MSFEPGSRIFDYEVVAELGAGGMGKVYKVRNVISDRTDAMKVLLPDLANQPELADRFLREIKVLASLNHPNIAAFHTALTFENQLIMVMEFVDGVTLNQKLEQGLIPLADGVKYLDQVLAALSYAHKQGVIHRDIKPANMMLTPTGNVKLMDFGIAKAAADPQLTRTGTTVGSLHYISPEQLTGSALDARSDLYSLGVAMYEILTGKRPFEGKSEYSLMAAHLKEAPRAPSELNTRLPAAFNGLILMALAKNPADRFQSADAFRAALAAEADAIPGVGTAQEAVSAKAQPATTTAVASPTPSAAQAAAAPERAPSHRGRYVLLGAVIAVAIIVASAVELPQWFRARARTSAHSAIATQPIVSPPASAPVNTSTTTLTQPVKPVISAQPVTQTAPAGAPPSTVAAPASRQALRRATAISHIRIAAPRSQNAAATARTTSPGPSQIIPTAAPAPAAPALDDAAVQALQDRMDQLSGRANAVKTSIDNLQQQVGSTGQSLRPDVVASESRMERHMDEADAALSARNAASAKHSMDLAEKEIEGLERFLGR
ncbi:MAG: protein kinase domain-containing protein [Terriglobia bacterium]